ncbi:MAG: hypothetical protein AAFP68_12030 [Pseudomonadota bacterium]
MVRPIAGRRRWGGLALFALVLSACASGEPTNEQTGAVVTGSVGEGSSVQRFDVRRQGRPLVVRIYNRGEGVRTVAVSARAVRGLDRADARMAYDAAFEASQQIDCAGSPMAVDAATATFQEEGRRSAFTQGEAAWIFQGRCGA